MGVLLFLLLSGIAAGSGTGGSPLAVPPALPVNFGGAFLAFDAPALGPGSSGTLTVSVTDPSTVAGWNLSISGGELELQIYRYAYQGTAQNLSSGDAWAATFGGSGSFENLTLPPLGVGASTSFSVPVSVPSSASSGTYFVRDSVSLSAGGQAFVLRSRGYFSDALWNSATLQNCGPNDNCTPTLNLTMLGVSGVSPETGISVVNTWVPWVLGGVLAASIALAGAAGYVAFRPRRATGASRSGTSSSRRRSQADKALGKRRSKDGD